mmetsp:Transcript_41928/g.105745  ORF Transcript_41928/g.105745 Transcript_41928/m.105745 type:complete len:235 (+) Transcript_41928:1110-1814(+)
MGATKSRVQRSAASRRSAPLAAARARLSRAAPPAAACARCACPAMNAATRPAICACAASSSTSARRSRARTSGGGAPDAHCMWFAPGRITTGKSRAATAASGAPMTNRQNPSAVRVTRMRPSSSPAMASVGTGYVVLCLRRSMAPARTWPATPSGCPASQSCSIAPPREWPMKKRCAAVGMPAACSAPSTRRTALSSSGGAGTLPTNAGTATHRRKSHAACRTRIKGRYRSAGT